MRLADSHCHLSHIEEDPGAVLEDARKAGVALVVDIGMGLEESGVAAERAASTDGLYAGVGIHPNDLTDFVAGRDRCMQTLADLAKEPSVVAVGETGLDFYRHRSDPAVQEESFRAHIELAKAAGRTLVIHCREAQERVLEILDEVGAPPRTVMHCFSGDLAHAKACAERGLYCSFAGNLTYKRNDELREAAATLPTELLLVETDAPFLAPMPFRGKPNRPALVVRTAETLALVRSEPVETLSGVLLGNTSAAFALPV